MPTTRYGVSVRPNEAKRYAVNVSASPVLSQQKRYGVQVDNKLIVTKQYPLQLVAYSKRSAHEEDMQIAARKEREFSASLVVRDASTGCDRTYDAEQNIFEGAQGGTVLTDGILEHMDAGSGQQREWVAPLTINEPAERRLDVEILFRENEATDLIPRERYIERVDSEQGQRNDVSTASLDDNEAAERQNIRYMTRDVEAITTRSRPIRDIELDVVPSSKRIIYEYLTEKLDLDATDTPYILVYEHQMEQTTMVQNIKPIQLAQNYSLHRQELPIQTSEIAIESGKRVADVIDAHATDTAALPRVNTTVEGGLTPSEKVRVLEQIYLSQPPEELDRASREVLEQVLVTDAMAADLMHELIQMNMHDLEQTEIQLKGYETHETVPDAGTKHLIEYLTESIELNQGTNRHEEISAELSAQKTGTIERSWNAQREDMPSAERHKIYDMHLLHQESVEPVTYSRDALLTSFDMYLNERPQSLAVLQENDLVALRSGFIEVMEDFLESSENTIRYVTGMLDVMYGAEMEAKAVEETPLERVRVLEHVKEFDITEFEAVDKSMVMKEMQPNVTGQASAAERTIEIMRDEQQAGDRPDRMVNIERTPFEHGESVNNTIDGIMGNFTPTELTGNMVDAITDEVSGVEIINNGFAAHLEQVDHGRSREQFIDVLCADLDAMLGQVSMMDVRLHDSAQGTKSREKEALTFDLNDAFRSSSASIGIWSEGAQAGQEQRPSTAYTEEFARASREFSHEDAVLVKPIEAAKQSALNETFLHEMDASERSARPVEESRYENVSRREGTYTADASYSHQPGREHQQTDAFLEEMKRMTAEFAQHDSHLDAYAQGNRAIIQDEALLDHYASSEYVQKLTEIVESRYERVDREKEREALRTETFGYADRQAEELTEMVEVFGRAERHTEEMTELHTHDSSERIAVEPVYLEHWTESIRYAYEETELAVPYHAAPTIKPIVLVEPERATRNKMVYTDWEGFAHAGKTIKSGVLIDAEQSDRVIKTLPTYNDDLDSGKMIIKTKKKIWLIPAHGNHWNSWSGWKKTR